jgi:hypothetical protein
MLKPKTQVSILFVETGDSKLSSKDVRSHIIKMANQKKRSLRQAGLSILPAGSKTILASETSCEETGPLNPIPKNFDDFRSMDRIGRVALSLNLTQNPDNVLPAQLGPDILRIMRKCASSSLYLRPLGQTLSKLRYKATSFQCPVYEWPLERRND